MPKDIKKTYEANTVGRPRMPDHLKKVPLSVSVTRDCKKYYNKSEVKAGKILEDHYKSALESNVSGKEYRA